VLPANNITPDIATAISGSSISDAVPAFLVIPDDPVERDATAQICAMSIGPLSELARELVAGLILIVALTCNDPAKAPVLLYQRKDVAPDEVDRLLAVIQHKARSDEAEDLARDYLDYLDLMTEQRPVMGRAHVDMIRSHLGLLIWLNAEELECTASEARRVLWSCLSDERRREISRADTSDRSDRITDPDSLLERMSRSARALPGDAVALQEKKALMTQSQDISLFSQIALLVIDRQIAEALQN